jgi:TetR/AcrR family transcriptional regulator, transcriptional repressor for nem operon
LIGRRTRTTQKLACQKSTKTFCTDQYKTWYLFIVARPRQFDETQALAQAQRVFHQLGYGPASMELLTTATHLSRPSFYNTFGDKHEAFLKVLRCYRDDQHRQARELLQKNPVAGIRAMFQQLASGSDRRGCLIVNAATEFADSDSEVSQVIASSFRGVEMIFVTALENASEWGQLPNVGKSDIRPIARSLMATYISLQVLSRSGTAPSVLQDIVHLALKPLG